MVPRAAQILDNVVACDGMGSGLLKGSPGHNHGQMPPGKDGRKVSSDKELAWFVCFQSPLDSFLGKGVLQVA